MIENYDELADSPPRETALACIEAGVRAAHPRAVVGDSVALDGETLRVCDAEYDLDEFDEVVVGGGNAAGHVAAALESVLGDRGYGTLVLSSRVRGEALAANDAHPYLEERGELIRTGATGTNVNDLRVLVVERPSRADDS